MYNSGRYRNIRAELIKQEIPKDQRKSMLHKAAKEQLAKFNELQIENKFSKLDHLKNPKYLK